MTAKWQHSSDEERALHHPDNSPTIGDTGALRRIEMRSGARGNQVRSLARLGGNWLLGASENLPGTHSADADPRLLTADASVRERAPAD